MSLTSSPYDSLAAREVLGSIAYELDEAVMFYVFCCKAYTGLCPRLKAPSTWACSSSGIHISQALARLHAIGSDYSFRLRFRQRVICNMSSNKNTPRAQAVDESNCTWSFSVDSAAAMFSCMGYRQGSNVVAVLRDLQPMQSDEKRDDEIPEYQERGGVVALNYVDGPNDYDFVPGFNTVTINISVSMCIRIVG